MLFWVLKKALAQWRQCLLYLWKGNYLEYELVSYFAIIRNSHTHYGAEVEN